MSGTNQLEVLRPAFDPAVDWSDYSMPDDQILEVHLTAQQKLDRRIEALRDNLDSEIMGVTYSLPASLATLSLAVLNLAEGKTGISTLFASISAVAFVGLSVNHYLHSRSTSQTLAGLESVRAQSKLEDAR